MIEEKIMCESCYKQPFCDIYEDTMSYEGKDGLPTFDIGCSYYIKGKEEQEKIEIIRCPGLDCNSDNITLMAKNPFVFKCNECGYLWKDPSIHNIEFKRFYIKEEQKK